jgi:hypothetical protein
MYIPINALLIRLLRYFISPGFSFLQTTNGLGVFGYANDASDFTHLLLTFKSYVAYEGFKVSIAADTLNPQFKCHKADVNIPVSTDDFITVAIPFTDFSNNWSAYTGEPIKTCSQDSSVCLTSTNLKHISQVCMFMYHTDFFLQYAYLQIYIESFPHLFSSPYLLMRTFAYFLISLESGQRD